jgi:hypothetical protein
LIGGDLAEHQFDALSAPICSWITHYSSVSPVSRVQAALQFAPQEREELKGRGLVARVCGGVKGCPGEKNWEEERLKIDTTVYRWASVVIESSNFKFFSSMEKTGTGLRIDRN